MAETPTSTDPVTIAALAQLSEVKGQLQSLLQVISLNHQSTNQRIDDLRHSMETRFVGFEGRVGTLEKNERATAIRTGSIAATASALVAAGIEAAKHLGR